MDRAKPIHPDISCKNKIADMKITIPLVANIATIAGCIVTIIGTFFIVKASNSIVEFNRTVNNYFHQKDTIIMRIDTVFVPMPGAKTVPDTTPKRDKFDDDGLGNRQYPANNLTEDERRSEENKHETNMEKLNEYMRKDEQRKN
jgi:hypothetical protein